MATTREQFIALRKSGKTPEEARKEVMGTVAPVTPSPTASANQMQYEINKQNRQNMANAGTIPAVGTSATPQAEQTQAPTPAPNPVLPTTPTTTPSGAKMSADGTVTPATPAPTPTPTPETPKVETPAPTPVTPTAATPVVDKVSETKAKNEAQMALNKQQAELKQAERDKLTAEANNQLANNEGAILNTLKTGGVIPESVKTSPFYKSAQQTYNKLQQYSTYSTNELVTAMNQGSIVPGTNVYNEMMKDPVMKQKLTDAQIYRAGDPVNSTQIYENASTEIMSNNPTTANYLADGVITQAEYDQATNNAQVVAKAKEVEEKANKYNTLKAEYDSIEDEVNAQFPGSPFADSIIADRQKAKYKNLVLAKGEWETATGTLTELKSQASTLFETNLNLAEKRREEQNQLLAEQRKIQAEKDMLQYKSDFEKKQAQEALNDPATQIKATMDEFAKLGIVAQGDLTSKIAEFKASGKTLPEYISGLRQQFMSKPEYQQILAKNKGAGISYQTIGNKVYKIGADGSITETSISTGADESKWGVIGKNADGSDKYGFINTATSTVTPYIAPTGEATGDLRYLANQYPGQAWAKNNNPAGITWNSNFDKGTGTAKLFADAGIKFEKGTARPANEGGNYVTFATIEDGLKAQQILMTQTYGNSTVGQMLSSWVGTSEGPNYAKQVAGMAGITDLNQKVSALSPEQVSKLQMAKIQKESPGLAKLLTQPTATTQPGIFTATEEAWANNIMNNKAKLSDITNKDNVDKGRILQLMNQKTGGSVGAAQTNLSDGLDIVNRLINHPGFSATIGAPSVFTNPFGYSLPASDARDFKAELGRLEAIGFLNMIPQMQGMGALSNSEGSRLAAAYSKLANTGIGEAAYKEELNRLKSGMELALSRMGVQIPQETQTTNKQTVGGELDYSKYE